MATRRRAGGVRLLALALLATLPQAAPARPPTPRVELDRAFLVGRWTDDGNCADAVEFASDGHFTNADGGTGQWRLNGDRLTLTGAKTMTLRIVPINRDSVDVFNADGSLGHSTRCAARPPEDAPVVNDVT